MGWRERRRAVVEKEEAEMVLMEEEMEVEAEVEEMEGEEMEEMEVDEVEVEEMEVQEMEGSGGSWRDRPTLAWGATAGAQPRAGGWPTVRRR